MTKLARQGIPLLRQFVSGMKVRNNGVVEADGGYRSMRCMREGVRPREMIWFAPVRNVNPCSLWGKGVNLSAGFIAIVNFRGGRIFHHSKTRLRWERALEAWGLTSRLPRGNPAATLLTTCTLFLSLRDECSRMRRFCHMPSRSTPTASQIVIPPVRGNEDTLRSRCSPSARIDDDKRGATEQWVTRVDEPLISRFGTPDAENDGVSVIYAVSAVLRLRHDR
ncbi:hypothetical protein F5887DRAFT_920661 [Amanita rubescens]|nr:hypothetical protein F5887DRAFT_922182 [Amanita rubescens]KAF8336714.1 hypothetical protein F5887DRAFT_920661 [Amanita rubescens]